ncbi:hypothetical protein J6590_058119, partial [Homalodisca vitripennis]
MDTSGPVRPVGSTNIGILFACMVELVERIQIRFIRLIGLRLGFAYDGVPVEDLQRNFGLLPLSTRRQIADLMFLKKISSSSCDSPRLLERINLRCPRPSSRSVQLFEREFLATNYAYNSTIPRIHRLGNGLPAHIDLFSMSDTSFRREVTEYLSGHTWTGNQLIGLRSDPASLERERSSQSSLGDSKRRCTGR